MTFQTSTAAQGKAVSKSPSPDAAGAHDVLGTIRDARGRGSLLWIFLFVVCLAALVDWLSATTQRLYVDEDSDSSQQQGTVWQHFGVRGNEVLPEVVSADEARFTFPVSGSTRRLLQFTAQPDAQAGYQVVFRSGGTERRVAAREIVRPTFESISLPAGSGELKFIVHGRIAWLDLRLSRQFYWPLYLAFFVLVALVLARQKSDRVSPRAGNWLALGLSTLVCLAIIEGVLRALTLKLAPAILTARHDLGLVAPDPRWIESPRYRQRLHPNLKTYCEWKHGDIVRMGFLAPDLFNGELHRYPFETDAEGFRNAAVRDQIDVAALGDSFAEAMTSPRDEAWPARLEQLTGKKVQNYGTSSFGPQQELYVLQDYAAIHHPREVVLGYFAGNDLFDAERFDRWEHGADRPGEEPTGWRLQKKFRRYDTLFLTTLVRVTLPSRSREIDSKPAPQPTEPGVPRDSFPRGSFDRGAYTIPTAFGIPLRFAFMPPYLQKLANSRTEIEHGRGWELVRKNVSQMQEVCAQHGSRLTVMFIPSKDQVYWPLVDRSLGPEELQRSLDFVSTYNHMSLQAADIRQNRLAQNELMREFCAAAGIPFLDLTPLLEQAAASGRAVYFADDAHWNAAGHEIAARELAKFLEQNP
jgi:hypothetical protein